MGVTSRIDLISIPAPWSARIADSRPLPGPLTRMSIERRPCSRALPAAVVAALGTTSSTALDPLRPSGEICRKYEVFFHVDAAYAGTALILPEMRWMGEGL